MVDAMGGDYAPAEVIAGARLAAAEYGVRILLVGDEARIREELKRKVDDAVTVVPASEVIGMEEQPVQAVRRKKDSSIVRAVQLVKEGRAEAMVSAGNTGAVMAAALFGLGRIEGVDRPALMALMPNLQGYTVLLDVGANVDIRPEHLVQFAIMGAAYASTVLKIKAPRVGILSIGEEETKGNELTLNALPLLKKEPLNFIGNVEGRDVFNGCADVVVCDGFVGNVLLKAGEGLAQALEVMVRQEAVRSFPAKVALGTGLFFLKELRRRLDYAEYGGAPLLGVNGVVIVAHGSSKARAIKNAVRVAIDSVQNGLVRTIAASIARRNARGAETSNG
ncbi:MAG: phosphate acyltransferase PlsX [Thermoanaerobacteraceae bacterium]|nr:phosphate acyltransferase PlsX [Thermoanaerobacteraceae bacterium]